MKEPCRSCAFREIDFGGCRCQAMAITGDARNTDPACALSPYHGEMVALARAEAATSRRRPSSIATRATPRARRSPNRAPWFRRNSFAAKSAVVNQAARFSGPLVFGRGAAGLSGGILVWPEGLPNLPAQVSTLQCLFHCRYHAWSLDRFKRRRKLVPGPFRGARHPLKASVGPSCISLPSPAHGEHP